MTGKPDEISVEFPKGLIGGVYSNNMAVSHTREEFIMDFLMLTPPSGTVTARVIVSPGHIKRIVRALQDNISRYEQEFGRIQISEAAGDRVTIQ
jgi:hypothetical protein